MVTFAWGALDGSTGGDDEVSGRDTLRGASVRRVLKHPSRWRSDPWRFVFGRWVVARALGVGRWVRGRVTPGGSSRRRGHFTGTSMACLEALIGYITTVQSAAL